MNIRRIIREEIDDFDWAKDTSEYEPVVGLKWKVVGMGEVYIVKGVDYENSTMSLEWKNNRGGWSSMDDYEFSLYWGLVDDNRVVIVNKLNEDLDWVGDVNPTPYNGVQFTSNITGQNSIVYTITDNGGPHVVISWNNGDAYGAFGRGEVEEHFRKGNWIPVGSITEDFDWTDDVPAIPNEPIVGFEFTLEEDNHEIVYRIDRVDGYGKFYVSWDTEPPQREVRHRRDMYYTEYYDWYENNEIVPVP